MTINPTLAYEEQPDHHFDVTPNEVDALVREVESDGNPHLSIESFRQYAGRAVYALTLTNPAVPRERKTGIFVARPHAHEPAGVAACTELAKMLTGHGVYGLANRRWRQRLLDEFVITLVPDTNPSGSQRAPVKFWTGDEIPRKEFLIWMFGESGERPGERFPRLATWDMRDVAAPRLLGIAYEQISEYEYVEPVRDRRSTHFRSFSSLDRAHHYDLWIDLHQTEFDNSDRNCSAHLPACHDEFPWEQQRKHESVARAVIDRWTREGARPEAEPATTYAHNDIQRNFLARVWTPISSRLVHLVTEVQNHNPATPPVRQVHLQLTAVLAALEWLAGTGGRWDRSG